MGVNHKNDLGADMGKSIAFLYGFVSYLVFLVVFLYFIGFVGNVYVPKTIDSGGAGPLGEAVIVNLLLIALFGIQHTVMARRGFKEGWTKIVPKSVERSTYVLISSLLLILLFWQWRPMTGLVWEVANPNGAAILWALFALGWGLVLLSSFLINHFELFGLSQVIANLLGKAPPKHEFKQPFLYRMVRHPLLLGFVIAFWATPSMTTGHLLLAAGMTVYILIAIPFEERDLESGLGDAYRDYQRQVPKLVPFSKPRATAAPMPTSTPEVK